METSTQNNQDEEARINHRMGARINVRVGVRHSDISDHWCTNANANVNTRARMGQIGRSLGECNVVVSRACVRVHEDRGEVS